MTVRTLDASRDAIGGPYDLVTIETTDGRKLRGTISDQGDPGNRATAKARGVPDQKFALRYVRVEPYVVPKRSLTGQNTERVDTRVLQVIYAFEDEDAPFYVGQQVDVSTDAAEPQQPAHAKN